MIWRWSDWRAAEEREASGKIEKKTVSSGRREEVWGKKEDSDSRFAMVLLLLMTNRRRRIYVKKRIPWKLLGGLEGFGITTSYFPKTPFDRYELSSFGEITHFSIPLDFHGRFFFPQICDNYREFLYLKLFFYSCNYISLCGVSLFKGLEGLHKKSHDCCMILRLYIDLLMLLDLISKVKRLSWILFFFNCSSLYRDSHDQKYEEEKKLSLIWWYLNL